VSDAAARPVLTRRRLLLALGALVLVVAVVAGLVAWLTRPATGIAAAAEDEDFLACAGPAVDDRESWDEDDEVAFWATPNALQCAVEQLDVEQRTRALAVAFPALDDGADGDPDDQWRPIQDYTLWLAERGVPRGDAMDQVADVLRALWVADAEQGSWMDGFTGTAVLWDMQARGELPGYGAWLQTQEDTEDVDIFRYRNDVLELAGEETETAYGLYRDRAEALEADVR